MKLFTPLQNGVPFLQVNERKIRPRVHDIENQRVISTIHINEQKISVVDSGVFLGVMYAFV
jgi:hypothetical protein